MAILTGERRAQLLLEWYRVHRRDLPWRQADDPWPILVSEVMLQQTQAPRVVPFFERFMARYPEPGSLAEASAAEVLTMWSGLGYNRRAIHLQGAARRITDEGWPPDAPGLQGLPGVGPYTAAAVACFGYGQQLPTVDTNLRRVLSRWHGRPLAGSDLLEVARSELPSGRAADWNQAVMDLGTALCRPVEPACTECPAASWCAGPETYVAPRSQGRFRGSSREARGAIIRELIGRPSSVQELSERTDIDERRVAKALASLLEDDMIEDHHGRYRLPES